MTRWHGRHADPRAPYDTGAEPGPVCADCGMPLIRGEKGRCADCQRGADEAAADDEGKRRREESNDG
jgi:hypothetical protein